MTFLIVFLMAFVIFGGLGLGLTCISQGEIVGRLGLVSIPMLPISFIFVFYSKSVAF